eukprot:scaffold165161_cov46-Attheya_sp.AAC.1
MLVVSFSKNFSERSYLRNLTKTSGTSSTLIRAMEEMINLKSGWCTSSPISKSRRGLWFPIWISSIIAMGTGIMTMAIFMHLWAKAILN